MPPVSLPFPTWGRSSDADTCIFQVTGYTSKWVEIQESQSVCSWGAHGMQACDSLCGKQNTDPKGQHKLPLKRSGSFQSNYSQDVFVGLKTLKPAHAPKSPEWEHHLATRPIDSSCLQASGALQPLVGGLGCRRNGTEEGAHEKPEKPRMGPTLLVESSLPGAATAATTPEVVWGIGKTLRSPGNPTHTSWKNPGKTYCRNYGSFNDT